jgi:ABC-type transport system involved in multi-copper enzyme maturation permease subunit
VGVVVLWLFIFIPYYTLGEDIKMLKNTGLTLIMVLCIIQAIWGASNSIADEIEGRTALTVLSKPLSRWQFILGKYSGIMWSTAVLFLILSLVFLVCVAYKPVYDSKEGAEADVTWQMSHYELVQTVPGLALAFMETAVLAAVSVAISTRLPMMANFIICFSIYVLGHLTPLMVQSAVVNEAFEPVVFIGRLIATIFPVLENLNIQAAVAGGREVPLEYLGWAFLYSLLYGAIAMLLALTLFEDRDLA